MYIYICIYIHKHVHPYIDIYEVTDNTNLYDPPYELVTDFGVKGVWRYLSGSEREREFFVDNLLVPIH